LSQSLKPGAVASREDHCPTAAIAHRNLRTFTIYCTPDIGILRADVLEH
jgi:hypothetical protein